MIWPDNITLENFCEEVDKFKSDPNHFIGDPPIKAQYALDLIFKTLIDDKEDLPYLTSIPENDEQVNSIMLHIILYKYSRKYRKLLKKRSKRK